MSSSIRSAIVPTWLIALGLVTLWAPVQGLAGFALLIAFGVFGVPLLITVALWKKSV